MSKVKFVLKKLMNYFAIFVGGDETRSGYVQYVEAI